MSADLGNAYDIARVRRVVTVPVISSDGLVKSVDYGILARSGLYNILTY